MVTTSTQIDVSIRSMFTNRTLLINMLYGSVFFINVERSLSGSCREFVFISTVKFLLVTLQIIRMVFHRSNKKTPGSEMFMVVVMAECR